MYKGKHISIELGDQQLAELILDMDDKAVNVFNAEMVQEFANALDALEASEVCQGLLIRSAKPAFVAGADVKEFASVFREGSEKISQVLYNSNNNFNRLEDFPFPVVAAIDGFALGGGCELALACDYRIATEKTKIGLPETRLGIIPGWGGTVRLPRIAGIETAVQWVAAAKEHSAKAAMSDGVIDGVATVENLREVALTTLRRCVNGELNYQKRRRQKKSPLNHTDIELSMAFATCRAMVSAQAGRHYPAPLTAVTVLEESARLTRDEALQKETAAFIEMAQTSVALSLSGIFISDQIVAKKAKEMASVTENEIKQSAVLGAGIMGGGIAYQSALKGVPIILKDVQQSGLDIGMQEAQKLLEKKVNRGLLSISDMAKVFNRIQPVLHYADFEETDIVVEAVVENQKIKASVLKETEEKVTADTILCSNTSTISISKLGNMLQRPENFCGMHFFNPVHAMPLVEVIRGEKSSDKAIAATVAYALAMGKKVVVVNDCAGFLVNRVLFPYFIAFALLVKEGVSFERIDKVMEKWGWPMGPAYLLDVIGLDTAVHAEKVMAEAYPSRMQRDFKSAIETLFENNFLGQKSQQGFYQYSKDKRGKPVKAVSAKAIELVPSKEHALSDEDIIYRMMIPMATELARCLEENIVATAEEADMALIYGLGFPPFRGGVFRWLDDIGLSTLFKQMESCEHLGELYQPTPGMKKQLEAAQVYYPVGGQNDA